MNCMFLYIPYRCKIEQPATEQRKGFKIQKWKCSCGNSFIKITWKLLTLKMSIYQIKS